MSSLNSIIDKQFPKWAKKLHFTREDMWVVITQKCSAPFITEEMKITTMRYHHSRMNKIKD
jgi:hypothetical protein